MTATALVAAPGVTITGLDEWLHRLGDVPLSRVRLAGWPCGEEGYLAILARKEGRYELVDGFLVEKTVGAYESHLALVLAEILGPFVRAKGLGFLIGEFGPVRIEGQVRMPDLAFYSWGQFPERLFPRDSILGVPPDLAIEVLSESNTAAEMERKRRECFAGGTRLVWEVEPDLRQVRVYTDADTFTVKTVADTLEGEPVLPGFRLPVRELFGMAAPRQQTGGPSE